MTTPSRTAFAAAVVLFLAVLLPSCGGGSSAPTGPTGGGSVPTPTPTPAPTPTPVPTPPPAVGASCANIASGSGTGAGCSARDPRFYQVMRDAVELARSSTYQEAATGMTIPIATADGRINAARAYIQTIVEELDRQGLCAVFDGEEIQVRDGGAENENYDVITSSGYSWINYVTTCQPSLPIPEPPQIPTEKADPECELPPSAAFYCVDQGEELAGLV